MKLLWVFVFIGFALSRWVDSFGDLDGHVSSGLNSSISNEPLRVGLTLIEGAAAIGALCLDGSLPAYHLHRGSGSGANNWLIHLEGGAWCNNIRTCVSRKNSAFGSSNYMDKEVSFTGILSNKPEENPDFFNWNRVKLRYCDGASFLGDDQNKDAELIFQGQRIWLAGMEELMSKGMSDASQALLSGCSAGGLASILHCDKFRELFPSSVKVKCLSDAGLFLDVIDISGRRTLRSTFDGVVKLQNVQKNLPNICTSHMDPTWCFFPENSVANIKTPLFLLNAAYDSWQLEESLAPKSADPNDSSFSRLQESMLNAIKDFLVLNQSGLYINSHFIHCLTEDQGIWFSDNSPVLEGKRIAQSVGDWYFD
ncbi:hypothetical protein MRB53_028904 [Persea americana]|uniref:Uncharacterized protein n=1 Tax=Persea americana TaxID=3435 RepID=A0ACC2KGV1_PERAE|nr:hypothetical protein MRB53_028904 [Persea americana]